MKISENRVDNISREEIKDRLRKKLDIDRKLVEIDFEETEGRGAGNFFFLEGTPPKGYALYIASRGQLNIYDLNGKRTRILRGVNLVND